MLQKTIPKIFAFVISFALICLFFSGCSLLASGEKSSKTVKNAMTDYQDAQIVGKIASRDVVESSGIAASKCQTDVLWTHNDSGDKAFIYALNSKGENLGTWKVEGADNKDWEDIAEFKNANGECFLYIGDIGDNQAKREEHQIYRVREPQITSADKSTTAKNARQTEPAQVIRFNYPDEKYNAETLLVHPQTGDIYVLTKRKQNPSGVFKIAANYSLEQINTAQKIIEIAVPSVPNGFLTGGDISPDGRRVILCDYLDAYEYVLPATAKDFDEIWKQTPTIIDLGDRPQGEAIGYSADGKSLFATSEFENSPLIEVKRK